MPVILATYKVLVAFLKTRNQTMRDATARAQALDITHSFIVQAPAGSGKTELLIQRFLKLLCFAEQPEHILAITFTNKAVNEMRHRLLHALHRAQTSEKPTSAHEQLTWQLASQVLQRDKERSWNILKNVHRVRIQTIDGLCARLQQQMPLLSQLGASCQVTDNPDALYQEAIERWMEHLSIESPWHEAMTTLLLHCDNNYSTIETLLTRMLARRDQWLYHLHASHSRETLEDNLRAVTDDIFLNAFDVRKAQKEVDTLYETVDEAKARLIPRKKFQFSRKRVAPSAPIDGANLVNVTGSINSPSKSTTTTLADTRNAHLEEDEHTVSDLSD
jgi:ATP-dependent exoDNAse (exonuclease V) beta subunit